MFWITLFNLFTFTYAINQLSFSGGGSFGAVEIGIAKRILESDSKKYDLYTGISAGALNSGFLSYFENLDTGIKFAEKLYGEIHNRMIFELLPTTGISVLNTTPLHKTLTAVIDGMPNQPVIHTLIGATNLYSGNLDVYTFEDNDDVDKVLLLMSSSAIPGVFPPINYNGFLYADGGTLSNEILQAEHRDYLNITYITPYEGYLYNDAPINSLKDMLVRTFQIVSGNFNNPLSTMNQDCAKPIGEINKYFVKPEYLSGYSSMNFDYGSELIEIGYKYTSKMRFKIC
jgi:predicted patatin/cPLA2 family phospholipase